MSASFTFSNVIEILKNRHLFAFVEFYLTRRYEELLELDASFLDTYSFVNKLLTGLMDQGLDVTRAKFFNPQVYLCLKRMYQKVIDKRFDFDAKVFLPILKELPSNASVLDFGAGNNHFLPAMSRRLGRSDISYYATDYFTTNKNVQNRDGVRFIPQHSPQDLPDQGNLFDLILLRRTAHHISDLPKLIPRFYDALKINAKLVLIEDSFADNEPDLWPEVKFLVDIDLTCAFYLNLNFNERIEFLQFNDFYTNYLYHNWTNMPLPLVHRSFNEWEKVFWGSGLKIHGKYNLGFPQKGLNLHQAATGVLCWMKVLETVEELRFRKP